MTLKPGCVTCEHVADVRGIDLTQPTPALREEWTVRHAQGIHPGPFTEKSARAWIANDIENDKRRQFAYQGKQRLLRRYVSEWEEVPFDDEVQS